MFAMSFEKIERTADRAFCVTRPEFCGIAGECRSSCSSATRLAWPGAPIGCEVAADCNFIRHRRRPTRSRPPSLSASSTPSRALPSPRPRRVHKLDFPMVWYIFGRLSRSYVRFRSPTTSPVSTFPKEPATMPRLISNLTKRKSALAANPFIRNSG